MRDGAVPAGRHRERFRGNSDWGVGAEQADRRGSGGLIDVAIERLADRRVTAPVAGIDAQRAGDRGIGQEQMALAYTYALARRADEKEVIFSAADPGIVFTDFGKKAGGLAGLSDRLLRPGRATADRQP